MITGTTTTSMMAVELSRISRSADATGPCGSSTPAPRQEPAKHAATRAAGICPFAEAPCRRGSLTCAPFGSCHPVSGDRLWLDRIAATCACSDQRKVNYRQLLAAAYRDLFVLIEGRRLPL